MDVDLEDVLLWWYHGTFREIMEMISMVNIKSHLKLLEIFW